MLSNCVEYPVHLGGPPSMVCVVHLLHKVVQRLLHKEERMNVDEIIKRLPRDYLKEKKTFYLFAFLQGQRFPNVGDVIK